MRFLLVLFLLAASAADQGGPRAQNSHTTESLRGVSAISRSNIWASGTHGTYLRTTNGGATWTVGQVPDAAALDFRGVVAFSADEAFLMSSGTGELSKIYHTADAGAHWQLQFLNANPKGFLDSIAFWDRTHGIALGDPVPDDRGTLKFEILVTEDGRNWSVAQTAGMPPAMEGEGAFAASNSCIAILPGGSDVWFASGGKVARVFHSADRGKTWTVVDSPIAHGPESAGIFSIAFRDAQHGVIAGGDYKHPNEDGPNLALTADGGKTWTLSALHPQAYFSAVAYDRGDRERMLILGQDFVLNFRTPADVRRLSAGDMKLNAMAVFSEGGAAVVGVKGAIAIVP
jgi:photosystem II stability/assembly factor-like uncharacterized protein